MSGVGQEDNLGLQRCQHPLTVRCKLPAFFDVIVTSSKISLTHSLLICEAACA